MKTTKKILKFMQENQDKNLSPLIYTAGQIGYNLNISSYEEVDRALAQLISKGKVIYIQPFYTNNKYPKHYYGLKGAF